MKSPRPISLLAAFWVLALAACAPTQRGEIERKSPPSWPAPPDTPRFIYETTLRAPIDIIRTTERDRVRQLLTGSEPPDKPVFEKPAAVAAHKGRIYVADTAKRLIIVFDVPRRRVFQFGWRENGRMAKPTGMALDAAGNVYVADATMKRVHVYDGLGLYLRALGEASEFVRPVGVGVNADGSRIYVVDRATNESARHRVVALDREGNQLFELGPRGSADGQFNVPVQAAVAPDGTLYVLDAGNFRVQVFSADGRFLRAFGEVGAGLGQFARPRGIAVDGEGNVYVADASFGNFQIFDREGRLLLTVGQQGREDRPGRYGLVSGIAVDETGRVYVADQLFNKVEVIRRVSDSGKPVRKDAPSDQ